MRTQVRWFRAEAAKSAADVAGALALVAWAGARRMLASVRKAGFEVETGEPYFAFLFEALAFEVQVAARLARTRYDEDGRARFASTLDRRLAGILAENRAELLGSDRQETERRLLEDLGRRAQAYAEFALDGAGPGFALLRYFASLVEPLVAARDRPWIHDQVMAIDGPEAASAIAKAFDALLETGPERMRRTAHR